MKALGDTQQACLAALVREGRWPGGWKWDTNSTTARVLDSLVKRDLATKDTSQGRWGSYAPTSAGIALIHDGTP